MGEQNKSQPAGSTVGKKRRLREVTMKQGKDNDVHPNPFMSPINAQQNKSKEPEF